jgi:hypothetical protein
MFFLSLELGSATASWCAEFAFRNLVSMSATGSVIVMMFVHFSPGFDTRSTNADLSDRVIPGRFPEIGVFVRAGRRT